MNGGKGKKCSFSLIGQRKAGKRYPGSPRARKLAPIGISERMVLFQRPPIESTTEMSRLSAR
jgi:hypothetical protein